MTLFNRLAGLEAPRLDYGVFGRLLLTCSAVVFCLVGLAALLAAEEIASLLDPAISAGLLITLQLLGTAFMGLGAINWMQRKNRMNESCLRPLTFGNLFVYTGSALSLVKASAFETLPTPTLILCVASFIFAASFAWLAFFDHNTYGAYEPDPGEGLSSKGAT